MDAVSNAALFDHVLRIEKELAELKQILLKNYGTELARRNPGSLRGIWRGVVIDEDDFAEAKSPSEKFTWDYTVCGPSGEWRPGEQTPRHSATDSRNPWLSADTDGAMPTGGPQSTVWEGQQTLWLDHFA